MIPPFDLLTSKELGFRLVERMRQTAKTLEASGAQVGLAWLLAKRVVLSLLIGASKLQELEDNLKATEVKLELV